MLRGFIFASLFLITANQSEAAARQLLFGGNIATQKAIEVRIRGRGFFAFTKTNGEKIYTKQALLQPDAAGNLINEDEFQLFPQIVSNTKHAIFAIDRTGTVTTIDPEAKTPEPTTIGQIAIIVFKDPAVLTPMGGGYFKANANSGPEQIGDPGLWGMGEIMVVSIVEPVKKISAPKK